MSSSEPDSSPEKSDEKLTNVSSDSGEQSEDLPASSVFDFLYHDARRIASFLAQFEVYGSLQQVRASESVGKSQSAKTSAAAKGSALVVGGSLGYDLHVGEDLKDAAERVYDPLWTNARAFLNYLDQHRLIIRDLAKARIGQFVLVNGALAAFDMGLFKDAWALTSVKENISIELRKQQGESAATGENRHERRRRAKEKDRGGNDGEVSATAALELLTILPHSIMATVQSGDRSVWCSLRDDSLIIKSSELLLKHGVKIAGDWSILGVLDAQPVAEENLTEEIVSSFVAAGSLGMLAGQIAQSIAPNVRLMLGRPIGAFGVTPLLIFREISRD